MEVAKQLGPGHTVATIICDSGFVGLQNDAFRCTIMFRFAAIRDTDVQQGVVREQGAAERSARAVSPYTAIVN